MRVAIRPAKRVVVTDSTSMLPADSIGDRDVVVVPLDVVIDDVAHPEGSPEATPAAVAEALRARHKVTTSRPAPAVLAELYARLATEGCSEILSVHLSAELSATFESAQLAARDAPVPVVPVDTRQVGPALGLAVLAGADALDAGASAEEAADAVRRRSDSATSLFYVDSLEYLRRGGRIGTAQALLGSALAVKPLLTVAEGMVAPLERVRTASRALTRLVDLAVEAAGEDRAVVTVSHLDAADRAGELVERLTERLAGQLDGEVRCGEIGAVLGAHVGPGMLAVVVAPSAF